MHRKDKAIIAYLAAVDEHLEKVTGNTFASPEECEASLARLQRMKQGLMEEPEPMKDDALMKRDIDFMVDLCEMAREMNLGRDDVRFIARTYRENRRPDGVLIKVLDIPMMSDEAWNRLAEEDKP